MGSIIFAVDILDVNLVIVLGHSRCGAVEAAVESVLHGSAPPAYLAAVINPLRPAAESVIQAGVDQLVDQLVDRAVVANVNQIVQFLRSSEPILALRVNQGSLEIVGARYNLDTGAVALLPEGE